MRLQAWRACVLLLSIAAAWRVGDTQVDGAQQGQRRRHVLQ